MAVLILPDQDSLMVRRRAGIDKTQPSKWHFVYFHPDMKKQPFENRKCICGELVSTLYEVEFTALSTIAGKDLCTNCWKFGVE